MKPIYKFFPFILIIALVADGCGTRPKRRDEDIKIVSRSIKSISEEYKRIEKECNEIEVKIDYMESASESEIKEVRTNIRELRLAAINLISECKATLIEKKDFNSMLAKDGFNMVIIQQLDERIKDINRKFEQKASYYQHPVTADSL